MIVDDILAQAGKEKRTVLTEIEAKQILSQAGINCTDTRLATTKDAKDYFRFAQMLLKGGKDDESLDGSCHHCCNWNDK